ncbi:hypothetical protein GW17_00041395 [Ensete ventricosum]|nr:hypothetical protein GW17_00041395 [Ensete ventricosum]RZR85728.1 hypothetical protein BHM03_00012770 [Ensete ventricosum]
MIRASWPYIFHHHPPTEYFVALVPPLRDEGIHVDGSVAVPSPLLLTFPFSCSVGLVFDSVERRRKNRKRERKDGVLVHRFRGFDAEAGGGGTPDRHPPLRGADLGGSDDRVGHRLVVAPALDGAALLGPQEQAPVPVDGTPGPGCSPPLDCLHSPLGVLHVPQAVLVLDL